MNFEQVIAQLVSLGFVDGADYALRNSVRAAMDAGVTPEQVLSVGSATRGSLPTFTSGIRTLQQQALADPEVPKVTLTTREAAAGLPEGSLGSPVPAGEETDAEAALDVFRRQFPGLTVVSVNPDGTIVAADDAGNTALFAWGGEGYYNTGQRAGFAGATGGGGGSAPVARFSVQQVGNDLFRFNDLSGSLEPLGISVPPGISSTSVDRNGDLVGIRDDGTSVVIQRGFDYPATDPERVFALEEAGVTGFYNGAPTQARFEEEGRNARNTQSETEANRRAALSAATTGFQSVNSLAPQLGQLALANAEFTRDTLRQPSDFVARAFFSRGGDSPLPAVSQADVINQLRENIGGFNSVLGGFNASPLNAGITGFSAPLAPPPVATGTPVGFIVPATAQESLAAGTVPTAQNVGFEDRPATPEEARTYQRATLGQDPRTPGFVRTRLGLAAGGVTREPMFVVGEEPSGELNDTSEVIENPTRAPITVHAGKKARRMGKGKSGYANGTTNSGYTGGAGSGYGTLPGGGGYYRNPDGSTGTYGDVTPEGQYTYLRTFGGADDETARRVSGYTPVEPSGAIGFGAPQLPSFGSVSQSDLLSLEAQNRPPAVNAIVTGKPVPGFRSSFAFAPVRSLNQLTPDEMEAARTTFALRNESFDDYVRESQRRFLGQPGFRGGTTVGFAA